MKYRPVKNPPLTALTLLERKVIDFTDYGLLCWLKSQERAIETGEIDRISSCWSQTVIDALDKLQDAGLVETVEFVPQYTVYFRVEDASI